MSLQKIIGSAGLLLLAAGLLAAANAPTDADLTEIVGAPQVRAWTSPVYPPEAAEQKLEGAVQVRFIVDETGVVTKARAIRSTDRRFEEAAVQAVRQWRFAPATENGRSVAKCMNVIVPFHLADLKHAREKSPPAAVLQSLVYAPTTPATRLKGDDPEYPAELLPRHLEGEVLVDLSVDPQGHPRNVKVLSAMHTDFIRPALQAVEQWTFSPAMQGDLPLAAPIQSSLSFSVFGMKGVDPLEANGLSWSPEQAQALAALDQRPSLLVVVDPIYPYDLLLSGAEGEATVDFVIGANGRPEKVTVRQATRPEFGRALAAALECWEFTAALKGGQPAPVQATLHRRFGLAEETAAGVPVDRLLAQLRNQDTAALSARGLDARLNPRYQVAPVYPAALLAEKPAGRAVIKFVIDRDGRCRFARVISATREEFGWAAATAVERWVFDPPRRGGQPVDVQVSIPFEFRPPKGP